MAREKREYVVLGFGSTHDALAAESTLRDSGFAVTAIPAPLALGSLCGIALRMEPAEADAAERMLALAGLARTGRMDLLDY